MSERRRVGIVIALSHRWWNTSTTAAAASTAITAYTFLTFFLAMDIRIEPIGSAIPFVVPSEKSIFWYISSIFGRDKQFIGVDMRFFSRILLIAIGMWVHLSDYKRLGRCSEKGLSTSDVVWVEERSSRKWITTNTHTTRMQPWAVHTYSNVCKASFHFPKWMKHRKVVRRIALV